MSSNFDKSDNADFDQTILSLMSLDAGRNSSTTVIESEDVINSGKHF
jgi:hypothetical protein